MKLLHFLIALVLLSALPVFAGEEAELNNEKWPTSVDEAVSLLHGRLASEDLDWIRSNPKDVVTVQLHMPYGTGVRNEFGLWGKNEALLNSCGTDHAEECSGIIFSALWEKVRSETDPDLARRLDCHFSALERIEIDTSGWYKLRLGEMIANLQSQIDKQQTSGAGCADAIKLVTNGNPDLQCFVRVEYEQKSRLKHLFQWVGFRNGFSVIHRPPNIELNFRKECAWPERPMYFTPKEVRQESRE